MRGFSRFFQWSMCLLAALASGYATPIFVNGITIPGATGDAFGTSANNGRVGFFSDIYFDTSRNQWWGLSDRGPGGGTIGYDTRLQQFSISIDPNTGAISNFQIVDTIKFTNNGQPMTGLAPNPTNVLGNSLDPEGIVVNPGNGHFFISDEYGPSLYEFDRTGAMVRAFTTPANLVPRSAGDVPNFAGDTNNTLGKRSNRGFEGLAISPDGQFVFAMLQSPMLDEGGSTTGVVSRIVKFSNATGQAVAQYAYRMDTNAQGRGISALVAINDHEFFVLERNNRGIGVGATLATADKNVYKIDISGATDVSGINVFTSAAFTSVVKHAAKVIDLDANTLAALGNKSPEKWEGLAIGPRLNDGSYLILAGTDNDYSVTQNGTGVQFDVYFDLAQADPYASSIQCPLGLTTNCFLTSNNLTSAILTPAYSLVPGVLHAYKASAADLAGYVSPDSIPEPGTWMLLASGFLILGWRTTRR